MKMRDLMRIVENADAPATPEPAKTRSLAFMQDVWQSTHPHPFDRHQRIVGGGDSFACIEVRPDVDDRDHQVRISDILAVDRGKRTGQGREALIFLLQMADKHGVNLTLHPKAYIEGPQAKLLPKTKDLKAWYARYGFVPMKGRGGDMIRMPGAPIPTQPVAEAIYMRADTLVYSNPTRREFARLQSLIEDTHREGIRALIDLSDGTLYCWDGYYHDHHEMAIKLGLTTGSIALHLWQGHPEIDMGEIDPTDEDDRGSALDICRSVLTNPCLRRLYGEKFDAKVEFQDRDVWASSIVQG